MGRIAYEQNRYEDVVRWLSDYEQQFPNQTSYAPPALYMVVLSQLNQKDITAATKVYDRLRAAFPTHQNTGDAALQIYGAFKAEKERVQSDGDAARTAEITRQMAEFLHTYNELTPKPDFTFLRVESRLWMELEEWEKAEEALRLIVQAFADDASKAKDLELYVLPDLGESLLAQKEVPQAFEVLDPLVPAPDDEEDTRKPASRVVIDWCRSIGGWVEGDARNMVEIPGVGGAERLEKATRYWVQLEGTEEKWSCPWYELKFLTAYAYYQWGQLDSAKLETAKKVIADLRQLAEDPNFEEVEKQCGEVLRRRFLWLWDKVQ
jgi:tetratricopeptide (TPR) repeat protein